MRDRSIAATAAPQISGNPYYAGGTSEPFDPERAETARAIMDRCRPLVEGSPAWRYLVEARDLPPDAILRCKTDLRQIDPEIPGFDRLNYGVVALLRDAEGELTGIEVTAVGIGGARVTGSDGRTARKTFTLREGGSRDGLFRATRGSGTVAYLAEGRLAKPIALADILPDASIYGGGGRQHLGKALPPEPEVVLVADRQPDGPDADRHEHDYAAACDRLLAAGKKVRLAEICRCCPDIDAALIRHSHDEILSWLENAEPQDLSLQGHAERIARISQPIERAQAIQKLADEGLLEGLKTDFKKGVEQIRRAARADREDGDDAEPDINPAQGSPISFPDIEPWPEPVPGAALLDDLAKTFAAHLSLPPGGATKAALWTAHAYAFDASPITPRLAISSPEKGCGKTTLLDLVSLLAPRTLLAASITASATFRVIQAVRPCLLIDEADTFLADAPDLRGVLNSGHRRTGTLVKSVEVEGGYEPRAFSTWSPVAIALIGRLDGTLEDRSIRIEMRRALPGEVTKSLRLDRPGAFLDLRRKATRWATDHMEALREADPAMPDGIFNRLADNWRPLLAIADAAGGGWSTKARDALLHDHRHAQEAAQGVMLLEDIKDIFDLHGTATVPSAQIVTELLALETRPWVEISRGRALTTNSLARMLKKFGIEPAGAKRRKGAPTARAYDRQAFGDAWKRYLFADGLSGGISTVTPLQATATVASSDFPTVTETKSVTVANPPKATATEACNGVTVENPEQSPTEKKHTVSAPRTATCGTCGVTFAAEPRGALPKKCPACRMLPPSRINGADTTLRIVEDA